MGYSSFQFIFACSYIWIKAVDLNDQIKSHATNLTLATLTIRGDVKGESEILSEITKIDDDEGNPVKVSTVKGNFGVRRIYLDTGESANPYPSIFGTHIGTITSNQTITVSKLCTYPCPGTGGHSEYVKIWNSTWGIEASWDGYKADWHNITFPESFMLKSGETYNYTIRTGSYPQIIHEEEFDAVGGKITCKEFMDANGRKYDNWIPAIKLC